MEKIRDMIKSEVAKKNAQHELDKQRISDMIKKELDRLDDDEKEYYENLYKFA